MRKFIASTTIAASVLGGGLAGLALAPTGAGAQDTGASEDTAPELAPRESGLGNVLDGLVEDGTLTQEQRDAVESALREARSEAGPRERFGNRGRFQRNRFPGAEILQGLGLNGEAIREGISEGLTLGEIAEANGSSAEELTQALTEQANSRIDQALENGRIDTERAEELRLEIAERVDGLVNGEVQIPHRGRRGHLHERFGGERPGVLGSGTGDQAESEDLDA